MFNYNNIKFLMRKQRMNKWFITVIIQKSNKFQQPLNLFDNI